MSETVGLIGYPLGHSISPAFQQAAFDQLGLDVRYELWETEPEALGRVVKDIRHSHRLGANVTVPYKEKVISMIDELDEMAAAIGAVNTIAKRGGSLVGYNTDAGGFLRSLQEMGGIDPRGRKAVIIGAGGVARAIGFVLVMNGVGQLTLFDIEAERAEKLAGDLHAPNIAILASNKGARFDEAVSTADLLVNCTPVGMKHSAGEGQSPVPEELIAPGSLVYDVVYNPAETPLLRGAARVGARALGGLSMLVYQGAAAFELWTGREAPLAIMMRAARSAL